MRDNERISMAIEDCQKAVRAGLLEVLQADAGAETCRCLFECLMHLEVAANSMGERRQSLLVPGCEMDINSIPPLRMNPDAYDAIRYAIARWRRN